MSRSTLLVCAAAVLWGTTGTVGSWLNSRGWPAASIAEARLVLASLVLLPLHRASLRPVPRRWLAVIGAGLAVYQYAYFAAIPRIGVALATLVALGAAPIIALVLTGRAERPDPVRRSIPVSLAGLALLCAAPVPHGVAATAAGFALALASGAGYAAVTVATRRAGPTTDPVALTRAGMAIGALVLAPTLLVAGARPGSAALADPTAWLLIGYAGLVPTAIAYVGYFAGLRRVDATTATVLTLLEPVVATALAVGLLGEPFGARTAGGGVLVCAAVALAVFRPRSRSEPTIRG